MTILGDATHATILQIGEAVRDHDGRWYLTGWQFDGGLGHDPQQGTLGGYTFAELAFIATLYGEPYDG